MLFLIRVNFRQGASQEENRAAAKVLKERLMNPNPGIKVIEAVADLGGGEILIIADLSDQVMRDIKRTLEFRALPAVKRLQYTPVVNAKEALDAYLELEPLNVVLGWETLEKMADSL